ncbi:unnamed protein product [Ilex paraguariensis]|uniref:Uncharacterized protein n=1 Tax=Ilex paraguariensis TaxID=185542 RepID=A0ABC8V0E3_9AQUA
MRRIFSRGDVWVRISKRFRRVPNRPFSTTNSKKPSTTHKNNGSDKVDDGSSSSSLSKYEAYKDLDNLNFMTAAKILFSEPAKKKKFGIDFHLVQLFFACLPSLAVYLVAQYARYEMRRMEAELELKKKAEEEAKAKEMELKDVEEKEAAGSDPELLEVKERLGKLEEAVKEIVIESKAQLGRTRSKYQDDGGVKKQPATTAQGDTKSRSDASSSADEGHLSEQTSAGRTTVKVQREPSGLAPVTDSSLRDEKRDPK